MALAGCTGLVQLSVHRIDLPDPGVQELLRALRACVLLERLDLQRLDLANRHLTELAALVEVLPALKELSLRHHRRFGGGQEFELLARALRMCAELTILDLANTGIDDAAMRALVKCLPAFQVL